MIVSQILFVMAVEDIYHMKVSDILQVLLLVVVVLSGNITLVRISIALGLCIMYLLYKRFKDEKIGGADIKILASLVLYGGLSRLVIILFVSSILGILYSFGSKRKKIPYVPFIWIGYLVANI